MPNAGLGVYSALHVNANQQILSDDIVINFIDRTYHTMLRHKYLKLEGSGYNSNNWILSKYVYDGSATLASFEADEVVSLPYSASMAANTNPVLDNAEMRPPENIQVLHRYHDVGAGASSNYHGMHLVATRDIQAGEEIFVPYGSRHIANDPDLKRLPSMDDFERADSILKSFSSIVDGDMGSPQAEIIWKLFWMSNTKWYESKLEASSAGKTLEEIYTALDKTENPILEKIHKLVKGDISSPKAAELWNLVNSVPSRYSSVLRVLPKKMPNVISSVEKGLVNATISNNLRSLDWLEENGLCLDNLRREVSDIPQAGHGAFATRNMLQGQVVAPVPVVPVARKFMEMYKSMNMEQHVWKKGSQLLLNYAFEDPSSSMVLIPYGPMTCYVNHAGSNANTMLRWSKLSNSSMLQETPSSLIHMNKSGLVLELVALRDIDQDEEVTLDYGPVWETAWKDFSTNWSPRSKFANHVSAATLNQEKEFLRTPAELTMFPYPPNVQLYCFTSYRLLSDGVMRWSEASGVFDSTQFLRPCTIQQRQFEEVTTKGIFRKPLELQRYLHMMKADGMEDAYIRYDVIVHTGTDQGDLTIVSVPRKAIFFWDQKYTSDLHLSRSAFRHAIPLPPNLVPDNWRDLAPME